MLKHKGTYEIICPEEIGLERSNDAGIVLGKLRYESFSCLACKLPICLCLVQTMQQAFIWWIYSTVRIIPL